MLASDLFKYVQERHVPDCPILFELNLGIIAIADKIIAPAQV